jgi:transposase
MLTPTHHRNNLAQTLWVWLASADDIVFQKIMSSRRQECAQYILDKKFNGIAVTDQCGSYNWIDKDKHQFCWAHIIRNLQKMADYSGKGLTENQCHKRMQRLRRSFNALLLKGKTVPCKRYAGCCAFIEKYETSLWVFLSNPDIPLTNNEAERCIRGSVILRKNSYGTSSERGEQFRSRVLSIIETCKKRKLSSLEVISSIVGAVIRREPYPDVFNLAKT